MRLHLTETNQTELLKEGTMLYEDTLKDFRQLQISGNSRVCVHPSKISDLSVTTDSQLPGADRSRKQVANAQTIPPVARACLRAELRKVLILQGWRSWDSCMCSLHTLAACARCTRSTSLHTYKHGVIISNFRM